LLSRGGVTSRRVNVARPRTGRITRASMILVFLGAFGAAVVTFGAGDAPAAASPASNSEGRLLVLNKGDDSLMVFDVPAHTLLKTIPVGKEPHELAVTPDGRKAYTANVGDDSLSGVDLAAGKVTRTIRPDGADQPHGLAITPDGRHLVVTSEGSHRLYLVDVKRDVVERSITTNQRGSHLVALAKKGSRAWIANRGSDTLSLYELPALKLLKTLPVGPGPEGIALSPNERFIVTSLQGAGQVAVVDTGRTS